MKRVLVVHSSDELYGADRVLLMLAEHIDRARFELSVVVPNDLPYGGELVAALTEAGVPARSMNLAVLRRRYLRPLGLVRYGFRLVSSTLALRRMIKQDGFDLVHSFTTAVLPGAFAARLTRTPHVWSAHEMIFRPRFLRKMIAWLLPRLSVQVVAVSAAMRYHLINSDKRSRAVVVIPNAVDRRRFASAPGERTTARSEFGAGEDQVLIGTVGRLRPGKGQQVFIEAAALAAARSDAVDFVVVGAALPGEEEWEQELRNQIRNLGIEDRVRLTGFRDDVPRIVAALDVYVSPSTHPESFGLGVLEAMAAGTVVVATRHGATAELIDDGVTGVLVAPGDVEEMAGAMSDLAGHPERRHDLAAAGLRRATEEFGVSRFATRWNDVYSGVLGADVRG